MAARGNSGEPPGVLCRSYARSGAQRDSCLIRAVRCVEIPIQTHLWVGHRTVSQGSTVLPEFGGISGDQLSFVPPARRQPTGSKVVQRHREIGFDSKEYLPWKFDVVVLGRGQAHDGLVGYLYPSACSEKRDEFWVVRKSGDERLAGCGVGERVAVDAPALATGDVKRC